jgi:hypothetical protein
MSRRESTTAPETGSEPIRWAIVAAATVVGLLHVVGALQVREQVYRGYRTGSDRVIIEVTAGGPADRAGLKVGDRLVRIDGIDAADTKALDARPRARVGQAQSIAVDRGGAAVTTQLVLAGLPPMGVVAYLASGLTGLSFLGFGLWAYLHAPRRTSRLLALAGIGLGAVFTEQPYVASPLASAVQESGLIVAGVFGFATLFHFTLVFPKESRVLGRKATLPAIYLPAAVFTAARVAAALVARGESGGAIALTTNLCLVLVLAYFLLAVISLVQSYVRATLAERAASGLDVLVFCLVLGLAPMVPTASHLVAPDVVFPGSDYYDLTWVLVPFAMARATILHARNSTADSTAGRGRPDA